MSDYIVKLIPVNPSYIPNKKSLKQAKKYLKAIKAEEINFNFSDSVDFIDCGENFESVVCPFCNKNIEIGQWQEAMDKAYKKYFNDLSIYLPCCGNISDLNNLVYKGECGFSKFTIVIHNPDIDFSKEKVLELELLMKCKLKIIKAHC